MKKNVSTIILLIFLSLTGLCADEQKSTMAMKWDGRVSSWTYNSLSRDQLLTQEQADKYAKAYADEGVTILNDSGCLFRFNCQDHNESYYKRGVILANAGHKYGIQLLEHLDFTIPGYRGFKEMEKHLDWLQQDARYGYRYLWFCFNNPDFQREMLNFLKEYVKHVDVDLYMIDEVCFASEYTCGCKFCRDKFHKDTGFSIPYNSEDPFWTNNLLPQKLAYIRWRIRAVGDFKQRIANELHALKPDLKSVTYSTGFLNPYGSKLGACMWEASKTDMTGSEVWNKIASFESYFSTLQMMKIQLAIADYWHKPTWSIPYGGSNDCAELTAAFCNMSRCIVFGASPFIKWPFKMDNSCSRIMADVAVLASFQTRDSSRTSNAQELPVNGWLRTLLDASIQFDVLLDQDMENYDTLKKYKVLVMASAACLSDNQLEGIRKFVNAGGKLIFSYNTALNNENAQPRQSSWLRSSIRIVPKGTSLKKFTINSDCPAIMSSNEEINADIATLEPYAANFKILAYARIKDKNLPLLLSCPFGKGELIYLTAELGTVNYQGEILKGEVYHSEINPAVSNLMKTLVTPYNGFSVSIDAPERLIVYAYYENKTMPRIVLHFLNMTGHHCKNGEKIEGATKIPYPIPPDIKVKIKTNLNPKKAWLGKLELKNGLPLDFKYENQVLELNIPGNYVQKYSVVFIE